MKRALSRIGSALGLLGVAFVIYKLRQYGGQLSLSAISPAHWSAIGALVLVSGASGFLLALAWHAVLAHLGLPVRRDWAIWAYGTSQLAKYVPGNVVHLAGRLALGVSAGLPTWPLAKSLAWELGLIACLASCFTLCLVPVLLPTFLPAFAATIPAALPLAGFAAAMLLAWTFAQWLIGDEIARAGVFQCAFLMLSGLTFATLFHLLGGVWQPAFIGSAYVVAWLIGLVTPGAPAGIGVREAVLFFLLRGTLAQVDLLEVVLIGRLVSTAGDLVFFAVSTVFFSGRPTGWVAHANPTTTGHENTTHDRSLAQP